MADNRKPKKEEDIWQRHSRRSSGRKRADGPPNLDELLASFGKQMAKQTKKRKSGGDTGYDVPPPSGGSGELLPLRFILFALIVVWALSGIFVISPAERGVVLRFGKFVRTLDPGPHWILELIESRDIVNVQQTYSVQYNAHMLTKDENIVDVAVSVQYLIEDPKAYLYQVHTPLKALKEAVASALRQVVGQTELDEILTTGRIAVSDNIKTQLEEILKPYGTGIFIREVNLQPAKPPEAVTEAFDDAIKAREDEQRYINQAEAYAEKVVPIAVGKAARITQLAEGYRQKVILQAKADVAPYLAVLSAHKAAPHVTDRRLYFTTLSEIFANVGKVFVDSQGSNPLMYLPMDKLLKQRTTHRHVTAHTRSETTAAPVQTAAPAVSNFTWPAATRKGYTTIGALDDGIDTSTG